MLKYWIISLLFLFLKKNVCKYYKWLNGIECVGVMMGGADGCGLCPSKVLGNYTAIMIPDRPNNFDKLSRFCPSSLNVNIQLTFSIIWTICLIQVLSHVCTVSPIEHTNGSSVTKYITAIQRHVSHLSVHHAHNVSLLPGHWRVNDTKIMNFNLRKLSDTFHSKMLHVMSSLPYSPQEQCS